MKTGNPIAFFDVDYTLCACYSGFHTVVELIRRKVIRKRRLVKALFYNSIGKFYEGNVRKMYEVTLGDMAGMPISEAMSIGLDIFEAKVKSTLYLEGIEEIERLKKQGYTVALLSSGPGMLVENMGNFLGADISFSNRPVVTNGIMQKEIQEPLCYHAGKVEVAKRFAQEQRVSLADCRFYSDSSSDLPMLQSVGHPVAVNPDFTLTRVAKREGWPVLYFKNTLGASIRDVEKSI